MKIGVRLTADHAGCKDIWLISKRHRQRSLVKIVDKLIYCLANSRRSGSLVCVEGTTGGPSLRE
jgi:hypothetical protein